MPRLSIEITLDNDAFRVDPAKEVKRIIKKSVFPTLELVIEDGWEKGLRDHNGHLVGRVKLVTTD